MRPSLEISDSLLAMYDSLASRARGDLGTKQRDEPGQGPTPVPAQGATPGPLKRSNTHPALRRDQLRDQRDQRRPLSSSSECSSSSSSSSSSSLPRGLDVKKSYLASIESLEDDEGTPARTHLVRSGPVNHRVPPMAQTSEQPSAADRDSGLSYLDRVLLEVVETERTYVRDLAAIVEGYLKPLSEAVTSKISQNEVANLFGNIRDIYAFNSTFLEQLEKCGSDPVCIARCFVANSSGFSVYTEFCTNYPRTVSVLTDLVRKSETAEIFKARQVSLHHSLPLGSYLLKPVQRILKYHLLLQNIVKHLDKESEGYPDVKNALSVMTGIAYHINDMKRRHEHAVRVQEIQSLLYGWQGKDLTTYGELVAEGSFRMLGAKALRHLFLFEKVLLIAKKREEGILNHKTHIMCSNLMLIESIQGEPLCFQVVPFNNPCSQYSFQARNLDQKREWCLQLKRVIIESFTTVIPSHAKQLVLQLGQTKNEKELLCDRSSARKSLSAPEYLKRRKYDRRKSESSLQKAFRLRRGLKKALSQDMCTCGCHLEAPSVKKIGAAEEPCSQCARSCQRRASSGSSLLPTASAPTTPLPSAAVKGEIPRDSSLCAFPRQAGSWRHWDQAAIDTSDTENEEGTYVDVRRLLRYRPSVPTILSQPYTTEDSSGEYVTFEFAHSHATRDRAYGSEESLSNATRDEANRDSYLMNLWARLGSLPQSTAEDSSRTVRRTQSFTDVDTSKTKAPPQQALTTKRTGIGCGPTVMELRGSLSELSASESPKVPSGWLEQLQEHLPTGTCKKCGSLPRSFPMVHGEEPVSKTQQLRMRADHLRWQHAEQRPFTIASDKPSQADFMDDPERYKEVSQRQRFRDSQETTGCTTTPAVSIENVCSSPIHPDHKIYRQDGVRNSSWKSVLASVGAKLSHLRSSLSSSHNEDVRSSLSVESREDKQRVLREPVLERCPSRESIRTVDSRTSHSKILTSLSRAYASVLHSRTKLQEPTSPRLHRIHGSSAAAARIARQKEPDYCIPKTILAILSKDTAGRPDSLLSGSSSQTSSDTDKLAQETRTLAIQDAFIDLGDDGESDVSDASCDSYYERTFEAIENVLVEEMFRDSAIYSDPEDTSPTEYTYEKPVVQLELKPACGRAATDALCMHRVQQSIVEKLKVLQESSKFKAEDLAKPAVSGFKSIRQRRIELEQWRRQPEQTERGPQQVADDDCMEADDAEQFPSQMKGWVKHVVDRFQTGT